MKVHFRQHSKDRGARALMLEQSLRALFSKDAGAEVVDGLAEDTGSRLFRDLPAFPPGAGVAVFVGLSNLPKEMLGRNWLVCTRDLGSELADFAKRNGLEGDDTAGWALPLLRNFEAVVFLDIAPFNASKGFAPWVPLHVAPNYPADLDRPAPAFDAVRIALIQHRPNERDEGGLHKQLATLGTVHVVKPDTAADEAAKQLGAANLHVHQGYSPFAPVTGMSPFDGAINRVYTVVVADGPDVSASLGEYLPQVMASRTYCTIAYSPAGAVEDCVAMIDRFTVMARNDFRINPELASYVRDNEIQRTKSLRRFRRFIEND